ncbi:hypothetical protein LRP67_16420 [Nocardioides sp. cx-169]|uniref:hypothetical protein n=1 Tax=Nocardioides sp. cx-169 TaxID=2899080 RepID=UPI001E410B1F|nr:hypothetical protein [Nocardioides sp. cx-169]MCD4535679.1 hypothetical protein [Nocardioides sp. cx-169]
MTTTARPTPLHTLAALIGGNVVDFDRIGHLPHGGKVYASFTGKVRLDRPGLPVLDLGMQSDGAELLAAAYSAAVEAVAS